MAVPKPKLLEAITAANKDVAAPESVFIILWNRSFRLCELYLDPPISIDEPSLSQKIKGEF